MGGINHQEWVVYDIAIPTLSLGIQCFSVTKSCMQSSVFFPDGFPAMGRTKEKFSRVVQAAELGDRSHGSSEDATDL